LNQRFAKTQSFGNPMQLFYFAYGSNMSVSRLRARVPSARPHGVSQLTHHQLSFHKIGKDGSAKCDAYFTDNQHDLVMGVLYTIDHAEKAYLDQVEGLGKGYEIKQVDLLHPEGHQVSAFTYYATHIDSKLEPFHWYREHVLRGAEEFDLPEAYIADIRSVACIEDSNTERVIRELGIYE
jgi:gamma-glutamylcyclotransferase